MSENGIIQFGRLVGGSRKMRRVYTLLRKAARIELPLLIIGETGAGKELAAREVHERGARGTGPFVPVNTGAISAELVASELFGHKKGAFTGALDEQIGRFKEAERGTLFLDEIGTMDDRTQITLLRVLEERRFRPLGAKRDNSTDIRLICATNEDLDAAAQQGTFRDDLLYRLKVLCIRLPSLRERMEDVPMLCRHFISSFNEEYRFEIQGLTDDTLNALLGYQWPGNLRELRNVLAQACVMAERGLLRPEHLPERISEFATSSAVEPMECHTNGLPLRVNLEDEPNGTEATPDEMIEQPHYDSSHDDGDGLFIPAGVTLEDVEKQYTLKTLSLCDNNKTRAAKILGVSRKTLYDRLDRWGAN